MKSRFLDKLVKRLDQIDPDSLQTHFLRLAGEKGLMETIFHAVQEGLVVLDGAGCISYANRAAEKLLGFSLETAEAAPISRYLRDIEWDRILELDTSEWSRMVSREIEVDYPEHRFLEFYVVPLSAVNEQEEGAVVILRDITRERENEAKVLESERLHAITLLAASVAHEIGNPLNSLTIHLQLLGREIADLPKQQQEHLAELVDVASQEVSRLDQIITQFLRALRPVAPELKSDNLEPLVREAFSFMEQEIRDRGVWIEIDCEDALPTVMMDRDQLKQAFFNLLKNAIQAMPGGGLLKIGLSSTDRFVAVTFRDVGVGMSAEELGHIFEPYHTTKKEGSGLGLMIVQRIVRAHGGEIEVRSELDQGTAITVFLPREDIRMRLLKSHRQQGKEPNTATNTFKTDENVTR